MNNNDELIIEGAKGKGGGGESVTVVEDPNTLQSRAIVRVLEVLSEGEIEGLATGDGQSILFSGTPIQNDDGSMNFTGLSYAVRTGLPSQPYMAGFPSVEAVTQLSTVLTMAPVVVQVSHVNVDAVRIALQWPNGLSNRDINTGDLHGSEFSFAIDTMPENGVWSTYDFYKVEGKATSAFEKDYRIERPAGTGLWSWRIRRLTGMSQISTLINNAAVARYTEIEDVKLEYNYTAYVGIAVDAQSTANTIPTRAYKVRGIKCQVPVNYNPLTRAYTGQWNGTFKRAWTDNPAWVLYDLLTDTRYGMGEFVNTASGIDKFSFYNAAVYNDQLVADGKGSFEPRFTFNTVVAMQEDSLKVLQAVASSMRAVLMYSGGVVWLNQDRPSSARKIVSNANVIDGLFTYASSPLAERHTVARVTYNDKNNQYAPTPATVKDDDGIARYGYQPVDVAAYGATTEGQAIRAGKWLLDTELHTTEIVSYQASYDNFDLRIGDVIKVWDEFYTSSAGAGRILSISGQNITLDKPITLAAGSHLEVMMADGKTLASLPIQQTSGTLQTVTVVGTYPQAIAENAMYLVVGAVAARQFRISNLSVDQNIVSVTATFYDPDKYARIEQGISITPPVYAKVPSAVVPAVSNITITPEATTDPILGTQLKLRFDWTSATTDTTFVVGYDVKWRFNSGNFKSEYLTTNSLVVSPATAGTYEIHITSIALDGRKSVPAVQSFTYGYSATNSFLPPTSISLVSGHGTGTTFVGSNLFFQWTPDSTNSLIPNQTVGGYKIMLYDNDTSTLLRTENVTSDVTSFDYTSAMMERDGGMHRHIRVDIYTNDAFQQPSVQKKTITFNNLAPAIPSNITLTALQGGLMIDLDMPTESDFAGILVWASTTNNFTPSSANLVFDGTSSLINLNGLSLNTTYYVRVAAYDTFGKNVSDLNLSGQLSKTTLDANNTNEYKLSGVTWTPNSPSANSVAWSAHTAIKTVGSSAGSTWSVTAGSAAWTSGVLYIYYTEGETVLRSTTTVTTAVAANKIIVATYRGGTNLEIGDGRAYMDGGFIIAGTVAAAQLVTGTAVITESAQIASAIVGTAQIADAAITNAKIKDIIQSTNYVAGSSGWKINKDGTAEFSGVTARGNITANSLNAATGTFSGSLSAATGTFAGSLSAATGTFVGNMSAGQFTTGAYTGYAWPAAGNYGTYLGPSGLLIGNANNSKYLQVTYDGNVYAPGMSIVNGTLSISQANVINTLNIAGEAVSIPRGAVAGGSGAAATIVTKGGPILVTASGQSYQNSVGIQTTLILYQNGEEVGRSMQWTNAYDQKNYTFGLSTTFYTQPAAGGTYTYSVSMSGGSVNRTVVSILETHR